MQQWVGFGRGKKVEIETSGFQRGADRNQNQGDRLTEAAAAGFILQGHTHHF